MSPPRLSACILARDEPDQITRAIGSLRDVPDEIVLVINHDASAATEAAAQKLGARVVRHQWADSFAAARNAGLDAASGDWVFWLDTDEELIAPDRIAIRALLAREDVLGYYVPVTDAAQPPAAAMTDRYHRSLYRRRDDVRYVGRVHEHFDPSLEQLAADHSMRMDVALPLRVRHGGYAADRTEHRLRRNVRLMELELADRPGRLYYQIELGRSLSLLNDPRGHEILADAARTVEALSDAARPIPLIAALLEYALGPAASAATGAKGFPLAPARAVELAQRWFPSSPPLLWRAAQWQYREGRFAEAAALLERVLALGRGGDFDREISFDARVFGDETALNLGVCYARAGDLSRATACFEGLARTSSPFAAAAAANLVKLRGR